MTGGIYSPTLPRMAMNQPYKNYQDIINGIASGNVNYQNYEELLNALGIQDPAMYALAKNNIEEALKYSSRNLNAEQANIMYSNLGRIPTDFSRFKKLVASINKTQPVNNGGEKLITEPIINAMSADSESVNSPIQNTVNLADNTKNVEPSPLGQIAKDLAGTSDLIFKPSSVAPVTPTTVQADLINVPLESSLAPVDPRKEAVNGLYNLFNQNKEKPSETEKTIKTPKKQQGLTKITSEIAPVQVARPDYTGAAYGSQVQPMAQVQPAESPIDESYYRYLRNNGWNDFDARRQAVRYY